MFVTCGLNHKTAPLAVREKIALPVEQQVAFLNRLVALPSVHEAAVLSTCNRTEIYCDTEEPTSLSSWLAQVHHLQEHELLPHLYVHHEHHAVRHILRVASGLDSMMLGEPQILGQIKDAFQLACGTGTVNSQLRSVFEYVFRAAKRIRHESGIGHNPVSIASAAVQLISQCYKDIAPLNVFIIGSGETAALVAKYLRQQGATKFMIASRTRDNAKTLAKAYMGEALTISDIPKYLPEADIVLSATACPLPFIDKPMVEQAMQQRSESPMFLLDLAVPRDIEPNVAELKGVCLYNIDDLHVLIAKGMDARQKAATKAEQLIDFEMDNYVRWHRSRKAKHAICDYREQMKQIAELELQRALQRLTAGKCQRSVLTEFSERLLNKLTHIPTLGLRQAASDNRDELLDLAQYLFNTPEEHTTL